MAPESAVNIKIFVVDTSYLLELFEVPNFSEKSAVREIRNRFMDAAINKSYIFVPFTCIIELADHIADVRDGSIRLSLAKEILEAVKSSIENNIPWNIISFECLEKLPNIFDIFANKYVVEGISFTDTNVIQEAIRLKEKYKSFNYSVHIWARDKSMKAKEPDSEENPFV